MSEENRIARITSVNSANKVLEIFFQVLIAAGKIPAIKINQMIALRNEIARMEEEYVNGIQPDFSDIESALEAILATAPPAAPPAKEKEPEAAPPAPAPPAETAAAPEPPKPEAPAPAPPSDPGKPEAAAKPMKGIMVLLNVDFVKKDGTAFKGSNPAKPNESAWYALTPQTKLIAKVVKGAKVKVYFNQGKKDRFVNAVYPA